MLQVVNPREEQLLLDKSPKTQSLVVSQDQRSVTFCNYQVQFSSLQQQQQQQQRNYHPFSQSASIQLCGSTKSVNTFSGQHYWEVYVGEHSDWELGITDNYLKHSAGTYRIHYYSKSDSCVISSTMHKSRSTQRITNHSLTIQDKPQKIGIYLNCQNRELSFYNADNMVLIHTVHLDYRYSSSVSAHFMLGGSGSGHYPLVILSSPPLTQEAPSVSHAYGYRQDSQLLTGRRSRFMSRPTLVRPLL